MTTPDYALPMWTPQPNWSDGVTERLEWRTHILSSETQVEQGIATRATPRRSFEAKFSLNGAERAFAVNFLRMAGGDEVMAPLWHDRGELGAAASSGSSTLTVDTTYREFVDGGMALLVSPNSLLSEPVQIDTVASGLLTLVAPTVAVWPAGTIVQPMRRARINDDLKLSVLNSAVGEIPLTFETANDNPFDGGSETYPTYLGLPVMTTAPDFAQSIDLSILREIVKLDPGPGRTTWTNPAGRSFESRMHGWMLHGRSEHWAFRQWLYRTAGRAGMMWVPSFTDDLLVAAAASSGATAVDVQACGLALTGIPAAGREHIWLNGQANRITSLGTPGSGTERVNLNAGLTVAAAVGDRGSFMDTARLDADVIEIHHASDTDGAATVVIPFRSIPNTRDGSAAGFLPVPTAAMNDTPCGGIMSNSWRIVFNSLQDGGNYIGISNLEMLESGSDAIPSGAGMSASGAVLGFNSANAHDGDPYTYWMDHANYPSVKSYIQPTFDRTVAIDAVRITIPNVGTIGPGLPSADCPGCAPLSFDVQLYDTVSGLWHTEWTAEVPFDELWTLGETKTFYK